VVGLYIEGYVGYGYICDIHGTGSELVMSSTLLHACSSAASHANHGSLNLPAIANVPPSQTHHVDAEPQHQQHLRRSDALLITLHRPNAHARNQSNILHALPP
jgi:hypothetical protein